jgi:hypothetical protein
MSCRRKEKYFRRSRQNSRKTEVVAWAWIYNDPLGSRSVKRGRKRRIFYVIENMIVSFQVYLSISILLYHIY